MEKRNFLMYAPILAVVVLMISCMQEPNEDCGCDFKKGTVIYGGPPEVDGCGWLIMIDSVTYHPVILSRDYQVPDLSVLVKYSDDPQEFRCGRGGMVYRSIRITEIKKNAEEVGILQNDEWDKYVMDPFRLDSAYVKNDWLMMRVSYSGGCKEHELKLWKLPPNALDPPPVELALSHNANGDMCEAYITRWLVFSLVPIREDGKHEVTFYLRGSPEMSAYFGKFTYQYQ